MAAGIREARVFLLNDILAIAWLSAYLVAVEVAGVCGIEASFICVSAASCPSPAVEFFRLW